MIVDRSPVEEPLIPAERTKIRLEMDRKKRRVELRTKGAYDPDLQGEADSVGLSHPSKKSTGKESEFQTSDDKVEELPSDVTPESPLRNANSDESLNCIVSIEVPTERKRVMSSMEV